MLKRFDEVIKGLLYLGIYATKKITKPADLVNKSMVASFAAADEKVLISPSSFFSRI